MKSTNPTKVYLNSLATSGRKSAISQLNETKKALEWNEPVDSSPFHLLTYAQLESLKQHFSEQGKSARTINHALQILKSVADTAFKLDVIDHKAMMRIKSVPSIKGKVIDKGKALSPVQAVLLLNSLSSSGSKVGVRNHAVISLMLATGLRRSELCSLQLNNYCPESHNIVIEKGKGSKARQQFLPDWAESVLNRWLSIRGHRKGPLFTKQGKGIKPITSDTLYLIVTKKTKRILGQTFTPHDLRRTYITRLLNLNVDLLTVSKMAGHANVTTTQLYDKRGIETQRQAALALSYGVSSS
ncbi:site-specific integrase [Pseudoalteromonas sp. SG44-1]|uniref:tyrosine-type recombinase/integrase n=1 Tax=Pseudoalteromonas sp. SG44-1 TaxID=2760964 RepID=UPI0016040DFB|nr:site-specific integrase [Pseudoalteromonas sp. SG44-1]MBB1417234.1 site-specific integrase [Pseudoalteromonas sp. SG44-1]